MKKLTRMKLINWHRFSDVTIDFGDSTLISGENGAGKSTLLDAIQFVITCSVNHFNKAAHENGKRKLSGYIRCKMGRENQPFERTGQVSAHVALEFYEESKNKYFIVGAVIDSATEDQETVVRYVMEHSMIEDEMFKVGNRPRNIAEFRAHNSKRIKMLARTNVEGKKMIRQRFGRIEEKFFQLIPKAMAFKPIDDIKDFVYSYVLDEKEVNIDSLRENVRSYQELEKMLEDVKLRIEKLTEIEKHHKAVEDCMASDHMYDYFLARVGLDMIAWQIRDFNKKIKNSKYQLEETNQQYQSMTKELENKAEMLTSLLVELRQNNDFQTLEAQKRLLQNLENTKQNHMLKRGQLLESGKKALHLTNQLCQISDIDDCIIQYEKMLRNLKNIEDVVTAQELLDSVIAYKKEMHNKFQLKQLEVKQCIADIAGKQKELDVMLEKLSHQKFDYAKPVEVLKNRITQEFLKIGRTETPKVLCELLEISDEKWRDAVEGYLNTQRFYILVEPENFDIALGIYDKLRREKKAYGVGLINAGKLDEYDVAPEGSLAAVVTSKSIYAKRYINMVLGKVHMCERAEELKKYSVAITPKCMRYQNHVASAIRPEAFQTPFIGKNAVKVQLQQAKARKEALLLEEKETKVHKQNIDKVLGWLEWDEETEIKHHISVLSDIRRTELEISKCREEIKKLEQNSTVIEKQILSEKLQKECEELKGHISKKDRQIGSLENDIQIAMQNLQHRKEEYEGQNEAVAQMIQPYEATLPMWIAEYEKQTSNKTLEQFKFNYERRKKANLTQQEDASRKMTKSMFEYKSDFDFGAGDTYEAYPEYAAEYDRLVQSELLSYEEKVTKARMAAEEEFREQFLSKLQENMKQAQAEFKSLNKALKDITFSNERYEFLFLPSKTYSKYYEMIMDDFNVIGGESIFSGIFHENHKEVIDELFTRLALDQENTAKTLDMFTDYRTYMDYDIKITHADGNYSLYSKVCEEKSGGETQTPFYVTVAASFVQLYNNNIGGESIGLVMFDEAFNNMDDERIGAVLEFMNRLPLQLIIAAPPDKIQYIGPKMQETLLAFTDDKVSYVEEYRYAVN